MVISFYSCINYIFHHYSKSGSGWEGGISNVYHDPCQDWMDLINMRLSSPNYPKPYSPLEHCIWAIIAPEGHFVSLDFKEISVSKLENDEVQLSTIISIFDLMNYTI